MKKMLTILIRSYQLITQGMPKVCRFYPSCSEYAIQAIEKYGIIRGGIKAFIRIMKCNPLFPGGYDPLK